MPIYDSLALETAALNYLKAHFTDGVIVVLSPKEGSTQYVIQVVANKYNPTNFWSVLNFVGERWIHNVKTGREDGDQNTPLTRSLSKLLER